MLTSIWQGCMVRMLCSKPQKDTTKSMKPRWQVDNVITYLFQVSNVSESVCRLLYIYIYTHVSNCVYINGMDNQQSYGYMILSDVIIWGVVLDMCNSLLHWITSTNQRLAKQGCKPRPPQYLAMLNRKVIEQRPILGGAYQFSDGNV